MKLVFTSYGSSPQYTDPGVWLKRINAWTGILEKLAINNTVIGIERINYEGSYKQNGVQYYFIRLNKKVVRFPWRMHRLVKQLKPDIVFVNGFIFPLQIIQLKLKLGNGVKIVVMTHAERPYKGLRKILQQQADRFVHTYFFTSKEMGTEWVQQRIIANENKVSAIMEASSLFYIMDREAALAKTKIAACIAYLWVGRLDANKDPLTVIKAFAAFIELQPLAKLFMIYHTDELKDEIVRYCEKEEKLQKAVVLIGRVSHDDMLYWYNSVDFIISGSHYEGSGVAVCEAMSCGCIPVVTNIQSFRKMTGPFKCGLLYEPGNADDLLTALIKTKKMNIEKERSLVLQQFKEELSFEAIAKKINQVIAAL